MKKILAAWLLAWPGISARPGRAWFTPGLPNPLAPAEVDAGLFERLRDHLFSHGKTGLTPTDADGLCLISQKPKGENREATIACLEVRSLRFKGQVAPAVQLFDIGELSLLSETETKTGNGLYDVEQWIFSLSNDGKIQKVSRNLLRTGERRGEPARTLATQPMSPSDSIVQEKWRKAAETILQTSRIYRI